MDCVISILTTFLSRCVLFTRLRQKEGNAFGAFVCMRVCRSISLPRPVQTAEQILTYEAEIKSTLFPTSKESSNKTTLVTSCGTIK